MEIKLDLEEELARWRVLALMAVFSCVLMGFSLALMMIRWPK